VPSWVSEETLVTKIKTIPGVKDVRTDIVNVPDLGVVDWP